LIGIKSIGGEYKKAIRVSFKGYPFYFIDPLFTAGAYGREVCWVMGRKKGGEGE